jgi:TolA-binding protein
MMPRSTPPESVPLPAVDDRMFAATVADDTSRARGARERRLPPDVLSVGTALRAFQLAAAQHADDATMFQTRAELDKVLSAASARGESLPRLRDLRAVQLEAFLTEVAAFEHNGQTSRELDELGGTFVERMRNVGWLEGGRFVPTERELRVAFKGMWNAVVRDASPDLALTLDEQRVLYGLYLRHPHAPEARRDELAASLAQARTEADCERAITLKRRAAEAWRAEKIRALGRLDPTYPTPYALGVALYRAGQYDLAAQSFQAWLDAHPDGPFALRARNHLKAAAEASGAF